MTKYFGFNFTPAFGLFGGTADLHGNVLVPPEIVSLDSERANLKIKEGHFEFVDTGTQLSASQLRLLKMRCNMVVADQ